MVLQTANLLLQRQNTYWWGAGSKELLGCGPLYRKKGNMRIVLSVVLSRLAHACSKFPLLPTPKSDLCETDSWSNSLEVVFIQDPVYKSFLYKSLDYSQLLRGRRKKITDLQTPLFHEEPHSWILYLLQKPGSFLSFQTQVVWKLSWKAKVQHLYATFSSIVACL